MTENKLTMTLTPKIVDTLELETMNLLSQVMERHKLSTNNGVDDYRATISRIVNWFCSKYN